MPTVKWHWYKPERWDWPGMNDKWSVGVRYYGFGLGVVRTYWGYRVLLGRWQLCRHDQEAGE